MQIKYNILIELLKHHYGNIILEEIKDCEITVVDENGQSVGKLIIDNKVSREKSDEAINQ